MPIRSQDDIHRFLDAHPEMNFIGISRQENVSQSVLERTDLYHFFTRRPSGTKTDILLSLLNRASLSLQRALNIHRKYPFPLCKGAQWISISDGFCAFLLSHSQEILSLFKYTRCPDEIAIQSVFMNSPYAGTHYNPEADEQDQCMREIDWKRGSPYIWKEDDFDYLMSSPHWFARKFSSKHMELIDRIYAQLKQEDNPTFQ